MEAIAFRDCVMKVKSNTMILLVSATQDGQPTVTRLTRMRTRTSMPKTDWLWFTMA